MATSKYIIRKNKSSVNKDGTTIIFLRYTHKGKTVYFSTGKSIDPNAWNHEAQQVKRSYKGHSTLNIYLSKFRQKVENIVNKALFEGIEPTAIYVRKQYDQPKQKKPKETKKIKKLTFDQFVNTYIEESKRTKKPPTIKGYYDVLRILNLYKKDRRKRRLDWEDFTIDWYYDFMDYYIEERGANNNTFGKMVKTLKTFLNAATDQGYNTNLAFKDKRFKVYQEEVMHIYLNEDEIQQLLDLDLSRNERRQTVRDLFVIGCYTGLRFGDFKQINDTILN